MLRPYLLSAVAIGLLVVACGNDEEPVEGPLGGESTTASGTGTTGGSGIGSSGAIGGIGEPGSSETLSGDAHKGIATFYDFSGSSQVACSFPVTSDTNIVAMNDGQYAKSAACGSCLNVAGPKGTIKVRIVDRCPGCAPDHIDLSAQAFAKIAEPIAGRVPITYQLVSCDVPAKMAYHYKEGSHKFWTALQVRDHKLPIKSVEYKKNGVYVKMERTTYNYFLDAKGSGDQPNGMSLRVTATDGQVIEETIPAVQAGKLFSGAKQFN